MNQVATPAERAQIVTLGDLDAVAERFWSKVTKSRQCWVWTGALGPKGYGRFFLNGRMVRAHRVAFALLNGEPKGIIRHTCDNRRCVRPDHLRDGSQAQNVADMDQRGRRARLRGEKNPFAKISDADVRMIVARRRQGELLREIAVSYGVTPEAISYIVRVRAA